MSARGLEESLGQISAADEQDAERVATVLLEDYAIAYVARHAAPLRPDEGEGWCVFYGCPKAARSGTCKEEQQS